MSPDIPLKIVEWFFQFGVIGFLLGMMALYAIFRGWHYYKLLSGEPEKHQAVFDEAKQLVRSEHWGTRYRVFLQKILSKLTSVIGDSDRFPDELPPKPKLRADHPSLEQLHKRDTLRRVFGINPFTVESYQFCFVLALFYPILSFILGWVAGGAGTLGNLELLSDDVRFFKRVGIGLALLGMFAMLIWSQKLSGWKSLVAIAIAIAIAFAGIGVGVGVGVFVIVFFAVAVAVAVAVFDGDFAVAGIVAGGVAGGLSLPSYITIPLVLVLFFGLIWLHGKTQEKGELAVFWFIYSLFFLTGGVCQECWHPLLNN